MAEYWLTAEEKAAAIERAEALREHRRSEALRKRRTAASPPPPRDGEVCNDWCGPGSHHMPPCPAAPSEPPAETQQDDERVLVDVDHEPYADAYEWELIAARSSADTETLADRFMSSALDNIGAFDGSNNEARDRAHVRAELVALLDGLR